MSSLHRFIIEDGHSRSKDPERVEDIHERRVDGNSGNDNDKNKDNDGNNDINNDTNATNNETNIQANETTNNNSVIEINSDDESENENELRNPGGNANNISNNNNIGSSSSGTPLISNPDEVIGIEDSDDDDEIQITGTNRNPVPLTGPRPLLRSNTIPQQASGFTQPHAPGISISVDDTSFISQDDDDIQITNVVPIERSSSTPSETQFTYLHTPIGQFRTGERFHTIERSASPVAPFQGGMRQLQYLPQNFTSPHHHHHHFIHRHLPRPGANPSRIMRNTTRGRMLPFNLTSAISHLSELHNLAFGRFQPDSDLDEAEQSIMLRIERDNENALDTRLASENIFNKKTLDEKKEITKKELPGYVNDIKPEFNLCCGLCGITLGEGIPEDFTPDPRYDANFEKFAKQYRVQAVWFCIKQCTEVDIELSKRIFVAKCGHTFCGRCVKNIGNRPRRTKGTPSGFSIVNPVLFAPSKCPSPDCSRKFTAKGFTEIYF
ncbi:uncharacterized protein RJT20DRAFT_130076 [Scheffersomyces xylosifermentans]|uniref:uncharacterized protein n=1 Tax=Scheffersomyces xylosifermentans TaxID=1304137 RepID=UPI00315DDBE0